MVGLVWSYIFETVHTGSNLVWVAWIDKYGLSNEEKDKYVLTGKPRCYRYDHPSLIFLTSKKSSIFYSLLSFSLHLLRCQRPSYRFIFYYSMYFPSTSILIRTSKERKMILHNLKIFFNYVTIEKQIRSVLVPKLIKRIEL